MHVLALTGFTNLCPKRIQRLDFQKTFLKLNGLSQCPMVRAETTRGEGERQGAASDGVNPYYEVS